jgi:flavin reductase
MNAGRTEGPASVDAQTFRRVIGQFASGVTVITTLDGDGMRGMTANAFMSGSLEPPLCVVSVAKRARMHERLTEERRFGVTILAHDQADIANHFAGRPPHALGFEIVWIDGLPFLGGASAQMSAEKFTEQECGDHTLFIGRLTSMRTSPDREPLLYHSGRYGYFARANEGMLYRVPDFW